MGYNFANTVPNAENTDLYNYMINEFFTLCVDENRYFPLRKINTRTDNLKFYVRPLECKLKQSTFLRMETWGSEELFDENCVDFEAGDEKPEIRVHG